MRLTKLEVNGFKAFADHTEFVFDKGVTAIVGPNGCGKSNVSDSVRWVLGEQRARVMRGAKMEDVIFHGSSARKPVNMAEVSLHFDNSDGELPIPYKEVVITRRLMRTGESEYLLNRTPCRLRDIQDLVRGTGLGADSGVVIESKMIDALLSDRPDDRRELFEEAAGVGLYRDRRRSAERRLEETTVDLARLDDLINEVQSQVRSLSRQRRRAERHAELMARRFTVDIALTVRDMAEWRDELEALDARLAALRAQLPDAEAAIADAEAERERAQGTRVAVEAHRAEVTRLAGEQRERTLRLERELAVAEERQRSTEARRARAEQERSEGEAFGQRLRDDRERAAQERQQLETELQDAAAQLQTREATEQQARRIVQDARAALEALESAARAQRDQARRLEMDREGAQRDSAETAQRLEALDAERAQLADRARTVERELSTAREQFALLTDRASQAQQALEQARAEADAARQAEALARTTLSQAIERHTALDGQVSALERLERERVGLAPSAQRLLQEREQFGEGAILGPLTDFLSADGDGARLVERYLGATLHAVVVRDGTVADAVRTWHASNNPGPLLLLPLDVVANASGGEEAGDLTSVVRATGPAQSWVRALLGRVRSRDNGDAFIDARGAMFLPGSTTGPGPLQRRAELVALREQLSASEQVRTNAQRDAEAARDALVAAEQRRQQAADVAMRAQQEVRTTEAVVRETERQLERVVREQEQAAALAERLTTRIAELTARADALGEALSALTLAAGESDSAITEAQQALAEETQRLDEAREAYSACQVTQAQAQARLAVAKDRERRLNEEDSSATGRLAALAEELEHLAEADRALAEQLTEWRVQLDSERATLTDAEGRLSDAEEQLRQASAALETAEHQLNAAHKGYTEVGDALHHAELRNTELSGKREAIRQRLETEWRRPLDELLADAEPLELETDVLRAEANELRDALDALGAVNPLAVEEHEEEQRRLEFLSGQRNDLVSAKQSLHQAIREIDSTARELFLATFTQVRENFRQIFLTLFGGGECDLRLENPDVPLDCDIEIHASPRGKRTQRIHLLSSGERALVALSLLFGIFLTKPSPFCLLDEVDAPLDDQNIGRFVRMLNQFKQRTQFLVITHNPRTTTEAADAVYGVTMQEPGVSSIVAVRMRGPAVDDGSPAMVDAGADTAATVS